MRIILSFLFSILCLGLHGGDFDGLKGQIDIAGGTAHIPVLKDAAKNVMKDNGEISISIAGGGSGVGVQKVGAGLVDIGTTGRKLSDKEREKYPLLSYAFAVDGIAVVVHPSNSVDFLTKAQVREIFSGAITNWKEVGGEDRAIHLYGRDDASGTREVFTKKVASSADRGVVVVTSNGAMSGAVASDRSAIGYLSIGFIDERVMGVALDGVEPTQENAINGKYPVVRKLYMHTQPSPDLLTTAFIDYVMGPEVAPIIKKHGYIPTCK